jgi:hypothetical protein
VTDRTVKRTAANAAKSTASMDVPEADVAEQRRDALDGDDDAPPEEEPPYDADPADAADQRIAVDFDDDEYR